VSGDGRARAAAQAPPARVAPAPLFDRLVDEAPERPVEARPFRTLTRAELEQSVRRELELLLNTRLLHAPEALMGTRRSILDYGIPDPGRFAPGDHEARDALARTIEAAVRAFEPRLERVRASVAPPADGARPTAIIEASLRVGRVREPVSFQVAVGVARPAPGGPESDG
jgi:type VI secretion system protein ImpF